jgi:hypothetical protein
MSVCAHLPEYGKGNARVDCEVDVLKIERIKVSHQVVAVSSFYAFFSNVKLLLDSRSLSIRARMCALNSTHEIDQSVYLSQLDLHLKLHFAFLHIMQK